MDEGHGACRDKDCDAFEDVVAAALPSTCHVDVEASVRRQEPEATPPPKPPRELYGLEVIRGEMQAVDAKLPGPVDVYLLDGCYFLS